MSEKITEPQNEPQPQPQTEPQTEARTEGSQVEGTEVRAAVLRETGGALSVETIRLLPVGPRDVRVRIDVTGVCHSDLSLSTGKLGQQMPAVLGHEACGTVVEVGPEVDDLETGQRVILLWITPCGQCFHCTHDEPHLCEAAGRRAQQPYASTADGEPIYPGLSVGSFAEQTVVPRNGVVLVPDDISTADAALLGCAVTTGVGAATRTAEVTSGSSVVVIGLGGVGLSALQGARLAGASTLIAIDRNPDKEDAARAAGATEFVVADDRTKKSVRALTDGRGADFTFDCVGLPATIRDAWSMARRGGSVCLVGIGGKDDVVPFNALELFHFARTLRGCVAGSLDATADFPGYFERVRTGELDLSSMVTGHGHLEDVRTALDDLAAGHGIRTLIAPNVQGAHR